MARVVMVVGGTSGIGLAAVERCVARGDDVIVVARDRERLSAVAASLVGDGRVTTAVVDVADLAAVTSAVAHAVETFGRLDAVISTAQPMAYGTVEQVPAEAVERMVAVAVGGTRNLAQAALPRFRTQGGGSLVIVGSLLSQIAVPAMGVYCAAKAAQHALVRALQQEVRREAGIEVSLVVPGAIDTPIYHQAATWAGSRGSAPPPVIRAERAAEVCLACLERPRRVVHVGVGNRAVIAGYRWAPWLYDQLAPRLVDAVVLRGPSVEADDGHDGNLYRAQPDAEAVSGGWTRGGRLDAGSGPRWRRGRRAR